MQSVAVVVAIETEVFAAVVAAAAGSSEQVAAESSVTVAAIVAAAEKELSLPELELFVTEPNEAAVPLAAALIAAVLVAAEDN